MTKKSIRVSRGNLGTAQAQRIYNSCSVQFIVYIVVKCNSEHPPGSDSFNWLLCYPHHLLYNVSLETSNS